ncbi:hypothetical protein BB561_001456 [Smittium simulii]|uniref:FAD-binding PCMH-type domain-containing protein n=1 Tax=Smittium simulii TaxID=133385 RepID=A0A2T9YUJ1_9FUNG|nr:hypothetical protein BB561_001456 [Smittium simulii]
MKFKHHQHGKLQSLFAQMLKKPTQTRLFSAIIQKQGYPKTPLNTTNKQDYCLPSFRNQKRYSTTVKKNPSFKQVSVEDISFFESVLGKQNILATKDLGGDCELTDLDSYNISWIPEFHGASKVVLLPTSATQVTVVPQGGNSGAQGGCVPVFDEIILCLSKMNQIRDLDHDSGALLCDAGCILENLNNYLGQYNLTMPIDLGAKGSCHIGGNISTNAGGVRYLKYGSLHGSVLGLEVLSDGTIINNMSKLRKDSTGYDLKQIFIGAEGTLGIVTGVSILAVQKPAFVNVAMLGLNSFDDVLKAFKYSKNHLSEILLAFEFWDADCMKSSLSFHKFQNPFSQNYSFYVLIETGGSNSHHDEQKLYKFLDEAMTKGVAANGVIAQDFTQQKKLWNIREGIIESLVKTGSPYKYDLSIPIGKLYDIVNDVKERLVNAGVYNEKVSSNEHKPLITSVNGFGHIGDGNLHLNVVANKFDKSLSQHIEPYVFEWTSKVHGSVSAEHGIGIAKPNCLKYTKSPEMIDMMKKIKKTFDPNGILNPYKVLPQ